jgi:hypothetical protein
LTSGGLSDACIHVAQRRRVAPAWRRIEARGQLAASACSGAPAVMSGDVTAGERYPRIAITPSVASSLPLPAVCIRNALMIVLGPIATLMATSRCFVACGVETRI